ncbi:MAG TPA: TatD family hydrolase [Gemmatimonadales bacterium]|nr:TatD family hydrolase [Gemmatimonadales bacterium]
MLVDAHCHLGDAAFASDRDAVLERAAARGVEHVVVIGTNLEDSTAVLRLVADRPDLSATAGIHPHDAASWNDQAARQLALLVDNPRVVAVGETGLDYHYNCSAQDMQRAAFEEQLGIAEAAGKPVVVHSRDADHDVARILAGARPPVILHSFSSGPEVFETGMAIGAYFSFSGMITFKNWSDIRSVTACPLERLLVETDAPYLAPVPHRGHRNEPAFVREIVQALARFRGDTFENVARATTLNARRVFGFATAGGRIV